MNARLTAAWTGRIRSVLWFGIFVLATLSIGAVRVAACAGGGVNCDPYPNPIVIPCTNTYVDGAGPYCYSGSWGTNNPCCCTVGTSGCCAYSCARLSCYPTPPWSPIYGYTSCPTLVSADMGQKSSPADCDDYFGDCVQRLIWPPY